MKLFNIFTLVILIFLSIFNLLVCSTQVTPDPTSDYNKLVDFANLASFAYCLKQGLTTGYLADHATGCRLTTCSHSQYSKIEIIKTFNFNDLENVGSGYCAIDKQQKRIILTFRGTSSRRDWLSNMDFLPTTYHPISYEHFQHKYTKNLPNCNNCNIHRGFYQVLKTSLVPVMKATAILLDEHPDYQLHIVGHSLGGVLSTLLGLEFQLMGYDPLVVSFACPKIGNEQLMQFIDEQFHTNQVVDFIDSNHDLKKGLIRVTHKGDIVPNLPPSMFYSHAGYEYYIDKVDLPHLPNDVVSVGSSFRVENEHCTPSLFKRKNIDKFTETLLKLSPMAVWKEEHVNYFIKISGCDD